MTTKSECQRALKRIHPSAELNDNSGSGIFDVELFAPAGMNWGLFHAAVICQQASGSKAGFWSDVLDEIKDLDAPEACDEHTCCEWADNECGVWFEVIDELKAVNSAKGE